jgi:hypothetical protein
MQLYRVQVRLAGDLRNVVTPANRGFGHGVVSWPEVLVLRAVHGADSVLLLEDAGHLDPTPSARVEKARLQQFGYPANVIEALYPGASPRIDMDPPLDEPGLPLPRAAEEGEGAITVDGGEGEGQAERPRPTARQRAMRGG